MHSSESKAVPLLALGSVPLPSHIFLRKRMDSCSVALAAKSNGRVQVGITVGEVGWPRNNRSAPCPAYTSGHTFRTGVPTQVFPDAGTACKSRNKAQPRGRSKKSPVQEPKSLDGVCLISICLFGLTVIGNRTRECCESWHGGISAG